MNIHKLFIAGMGFVAATSASATMRMDLENKQPLEIIQSSLKLASQIPQAKCVGAICISDRRNNKTALLTGVAVDRYTIITAAHEKTLTHENRNNVMFAFDDNYLKVKEIIVHPKYVMNPNSLPSSRLSYKESEGYLCDGMPVDKLKDLSFEDLQNTQRYKNFYFSGVDLAILKLATPLPENLSYPEFLDEKIEMKDQYGVFLGFGPLQLSSIDKGPLTYMPAGSKHALACKVSHSHINNNPILYGKYETFLINGDESFIPNKTMLSIEGIPSQGDSGGSFFVRNNNQYYLTGVLTTNYAPFTDFIPNRDHRQTFKDIKMPVYPTWHALKGENLTWVKENMGKK